MRLATFRQWIAGLGESRWGWLTGPRLTLIGIAEVVASLKSSARCHLASAMQVDGPPNRKFKHGLFRRLVFVGVGALGLVD